MIYKSIVHIAFLGPKGSYSHIATMQYASNRHFNQVIEHSCRKFDDIFDLVECDYAEYGVVPIENSSSGLIDEIGDLLLNTRLLLVDEITIPIKHCILVNNHTDLNQIQIIYSHPQPVQQCSEFLKHFSEWKIVFCESSAVAMKIVSKLNQSNSGALGSMQGGQIYGLHALLTYNLSNSHKNTTRFIVLKNKNIAVFNHSIAAKTILIISIEKQSEKLCEILKVLRFYNTKITYLRPRLLLYEKSKNIVIIEMMAHINDIYIQHILIELQKIAYSLKILGCYQVTPPTDAIFHYNRKLL
ncbi:prephenate dehydratase domain-containing protein [Blochmannia endosymbiont of Camponotus sp.]|uniref:prephenate dehydratase domain-containing protein n=1 Tax=Blochmannia endosymbiont of Camponotus sp. TaxID=700220 RepID=UPI002025B45D|nr:prephenate dehydratase domain-containing protein [Blochmannia endosymbiont of Camponotus sp.]URJ24099.1 chorismate mutase [Blochmannia endosymbiont of Camponotus sp.]URJ25709.1 chorismate mutase [Blochmannia endosymbiont of Camponotus sp.]